MLGVSVRSIEDEANLNIFPLFAGMFSNWASKENQVADAMWDLN